ncbi:oxidized purine nucleoside triphosphate hydrolase-like [Uloborus diversus]|uniref:oxidized purine nucleoside triphosphate hydrolase-like n=1 Tax=Uloborus diversus TaxID=327109 RepID=UPI00240A4FD4|nr:oxidized purine nucleoside triphosphate hydrolase-like [Uloborus diversus]
MVPTKVSSLVLLRKYGSVLLGYKKRGFGAGKWNGFGGKQEQGETMIECARRELMEEAGVAAVDLQKIGYLEFEFIEDPLIMHVHVFSSSSFTGEPQESEEMLPKWFSEKEIPFQEMWADDKEWFPLFLKGLKFKGYFKFSDLETIVEKKLCEVTEI